MGPQTNVLVVDDEPIYLSLLRQTLELAGFAVATAEDGRRALDYLRAASAAGVPPSLIILDWEMPEMGGREFHREQLADPSLARIPVIIITGLDHPEGTEALPILAKPFPIGRLIDLARELSAPRAQ